MYTQKDVEGLSCEFEVTVYLLLVPSSRAERLKENSSVQSLSIRTIRLASRKLPNSRVRGGARG